MNASRNLLLVLLTCLLVFIPACSDDDETPTTVIPTTYADPQLQAMVDGGSLIAQGLIEQVPLWMSGQLGQKDPTTPTWDPTCTCWRWMDYEADYSDEAYYWTQTWTFALTFYQGTTPQMEYEGADNLGVDVGFSSSESDYRNDHNSYSTYFEFYVPLAVVPNGPDTVMISGSGEGSFSGEFLAGEDYTQIYEDFTISINLVMPATGGCPTGSLDISTETTTFSVGLDGQTTAYWDYITGPDQSQEGHFTMVCGK